MDRLCRSIPRGGHGRPLSINLVEVVHELRQVVCVKG
jgi:hypothetical protein